MTDPRPAVLVVQTGAAPDEVGPIHGQPADWFARALGLAPDGIEVVRVSEGEALPAPDPGRVAVITGSPAMVTDRAPWSEATAAWIREAVAAGMPLFGVCYGHQLMAHALGGRVDYHPDGPEIGCETVRLSPAAAGDPLLADAPARFAAHLVHAQTVAEPPPGARVLAASDHDPHQILRYGPRALSVQFHPEFTPALSRAVIGAYAAALRAWGRDAEAVLATITDAAEPARLLRRFVEEALARREPAAPAPAGA